MGLNLHSIATGNIRAVNPMMTVLLRASTGEVTSPDFSTAPDYATPGGITASVDANGVMTVTAVASGVLQPGQTLSDITSALAPGTMITSQLSGSPPGGVGTYQLNSALEVDSEAMTTAMTMEAQVQPLDSDDLRQVEALNLQGIHKAMYFNGGASGLVRMDAKGGDLVVLPDGSVWLVTLVPEYWRPTAGWTHVIITLQDGS